MSNETRDSASTIWKNQPVGEFGIQLEQLRRKARKLERRVRWRNLSEYAAGTLVVGTFGYYAWKFPAPLARVGSILLIAGTLFILYTLHQRGTARALSVELGFHNCIEFHRRQLIRQRDLLLSVWRWYLLPLVPGMAVFLLGLLAWVLQQPGAAGHARTIIMTFATTALGCAFVFAGIGQLNRWAAQKVQREIDSLDALVREA